MDALRATVRTVVDLVTAIIGIPLILIGALVSLWPGTRRRPPQKPRILWGSQPIKSLAHMAEAARTAGYECEVMVRELYAIFSADWFDHVVYSKRSNPVVERFADSLKAYWFFARALSRYDVFAYYFDGGVLRRTLLEALEWPFLKLLGKKLILIPYGSDAWVADHTPYLVWRAALMIDDPRLGHKAPKVERQVRRGTRYGDCVLGCAVHLVCLPRWDMLPVTCYPVDTITLKPVPPRTDGPVRIAHAANHRGYKGTDFLIEAIERLQREGHDVEFDLIERTPNEEALERIAAADVYVDQLVGGYALAALEGLALGKVVLSAIDGFEAYDVLRRYSYLGECPIVNVSPETTYDVLRELIGRRDEWPEIGRASRDYCERRHSFEAGAEMWDAILRRVWHGEDVDLINWYHPLLERRRKEAEAAPSR